MSEVLEKQTLLYTVGLKETTFPSLAVMRSGVRSPAAPLSMSKNEDDCLSYNSPYRFYIGHTQVFCSVLGLCVCNTRRLSPPREPRDSYRFPLLARLREIGGQLGRHCDVACTSVRMLGGHTHDMRRSNHAG